MKSNEWNISDKVQMAENTTGTSTSTTYTLTNPSYQAEKGWECPRCGRINAPWVRQCDCVRSNWTITTCGSYPKQDDWLTHVTCEDTDMFRIHPESITYTWDKGDKDSLVVGGSDFWDDDKHQWVNVPSISINTVTDGKFHADNGVPYTIKGE